MLHHRSSLLCAPALLVLSLTSGCYIRTEPAYVAPPPPPPARPVTATTVAAPPATTGWVLLGERAVNGGNDRDTILVGSSEGRFSAIEIRVDRSAIEMYNMVVTFADGSRFAPDTRYVFDANTNSRLIDLPGNRRTIQRVDFHYGNVHRNGHARVELWAR